MNPLKAIQNLYYRIRSYDLEILPYRQYTYELKLKNQDDIITMESCYCLSDSFSTMLEEINQKGYIEVDDKQYNTSEIEYNKLIKINTFYAYLTDFLSDDTLKRYLTFNKLIQRQKKFIKYARYLNPKRLKRIINDAKNYYV